MNPLTHAPSPSDFRHAITTAENILRELPQLELETVHHFAPGIYARELRIPAGTVLTGDIHLTEHLCIVSAGVIEIADENGIRRVEAPATFLSKPGIKRIGVSLSDTVFTTLHATDKTDLDALRADLVVASYAEYDAFIQPDLIARDQQDYQRFLEEWQLNEDQVQAIVQNEADQMPMPESFKDFVWVADSAIHGKGMFAPTAYVADSVIAPARVAGLRTPAGRYVNHAAQPNCKMWADNNGDLWLVSAVDIAQGEELTVDYRQAGHVNLQSLEAA